MNKQYKSPDSRGIEWTDYTWNPVAGCRHACRWTMPDGSVAICYAETVAERVAGSAYPNGFTHHYWHPKRLNEPLGLKEPAKIFMDSMSDLMGHWVPDEQIKEVLQICERTPQHSYQLLTKNAPRLTQFKFPKNVWVGVSAPPSFMMGKPLTYDQQVRMVQRQLAILRNVDAKIRWMSIEPLSFDIAPLLVDRHAPLEWVVIGAATNGNKVYQPDPEWTENVLIWADGNNCPVFFKGNLKWEVWREEFPNGQ